MDITSYLLGKQAGGGSTPTLQTKSVTITENTTTEVTPDSGYDGLSSVEVTTNVPSGGSSIDWSAIGYSEEPPTIEEDYNYSKYVYDNWVPATSYPYKFNNDKYLIYMPLVDISSARDTNSMFYNCKLLRYIPLLNTSNVTNMSNMFYYCTALTNVPLLNTSKVTNISSMFNGCSRLISVPALNTKNVTDIKYFAANCSALENLPTFNFNKVTSMNGMFNACTNLTNDSLNNIMASLLTATSYTGTKTLNYIGLSSTQATTCTGLSNWAALSAAGWTTGY